MGNVPNWISQIAIFEAGDTFPKLSCLVSMLEFGVVSMESLEFEAQSSPIDP